MAGRRYSAGRIFLDVVPSFKGVMRDIEREADKARREVNKSDTEAAQRGAEQAGKAARKEARKQEELTQAELQEIRNRFWRMSNRDAQKAMGREERLRQDAEKRAAGRSLQGEVQRQRKLNAANARNLAAQEKLRRDQAERTEKLISGIINRAAANRNKQLMLLERDAARQRAKEALEMRREREAAELNLERQRKAREESALKDAARTASRINKDRIAESRRAAAEWERSFADAEREVVRNQKEAAKEVARHREQSHKDALDSINKQGGRFGQEMRKTIDKTLMDLPDSHRIEFDADSTKADRELIGLRRRLESLRDQRIGIDLSAREAKAEMRDLERRLERLARKNVTIDVRTNAKSAAALLAAQRMEMDRGARSAGVLGDRHRNNRDQALDTANAFRLFHAMILAVAVAIPLLVPAIGGLTAVLGGLIPMLLGAGAGLGVMLMGFSGIGEAVGALGDQQENAAKDSLAASKTMRNAAKAVRDAQQGLDRARRNAARAAEDAARRVSDAQQGIADAQQQAAERIEAALEREQRAREALVDAQERGAERIEDAIDRQARAAENVNRARERAADQIEAAIRRQENAERSLERAQRDSKQAQDDLAAARRRAAEEAADRELALRGGALAERQARLDLFEAHGRWLTTKDDGTASGADRERANIAYERAKLQLEEIQRRNKGLAEEEAEFEKTGVEGSDAVVEAKERITDSVEKLKDAEREVTDAAKNNERVERDAARDIADAVQAAADATEALAKTRRDVARDIADAERGVRDAVEDVADARVEGARAVADAEQALTDALRAQRYQQIDSAESIRDAQERLADAQAAYQEALQQTGEIGSASMRKLQDAMDNLSPAGQRFARFLFGLKGYWDDLRFAAQEGMLPGVQEFMEDMVEVYGPSFLRFVGEMAETLGDLFREMSNVFQGPIMSTFFSTMDEYAGVFTTQVFDIIMNLMELVAALATAFAPFGKELGDALVDITEGWASWADGLKDSERFQSFLDYARESGGALLDMLISLGDALITIGIGLAPYADMLVQALDRFFSWIADSDPEAVGRIVTSLLTAVIAMQVASGMLSGMSTAKMFFSKDSGGGFSHPLGLLSLALVSMVGLGAILAQEFEWFRDALAFAGEKASEFIGWLTQFRGEMALVVMAIVSAYAAWKTYQLIMMTVASVKTLLTTKMVLFGVATKVALGWVFLIVAALAALAAGMVWLYKNNDAFRDFVDATWGYMKDIASAVAAWFMDTAVPALVAAWEWLAAAAVDAWENYIWPALQGLWDLAVAAFGWFVDYGVPALAAAWDWVAGVFSAAWNDYIWPALQGLWDVAVAVFGWLVDTGLPAVGTALSVMGKVFLWVYDSIIQPVLSRLWSLAKWVGGFLMDNILPGIGGVFSWLGETIALIWTGTIWPTLNTMGGVFMWLWRNIISPAFAGIAFVFMWLWDNAIQPFFENVMGGTEGVGGWFDWLLGIIDPIWRGIGSVMQWVWDNVIAKTFSGIGSFITWMAGIFPAVTGAIGDAWRWMGDLFVTVWQDYLSPVFTWLWDAAVAVFDWLVGTAFPAVAGAFMAVGSFFVTVYEAFIEPVLTRLWALGEWVWGFLSEHVFPGISAAFSWLGETMSRIWHEIIWPVLVLLGDYFTFLWQAILTPVLQGIANLFIWLWEGVLAPLLSGIGSVFMWLWEEVAVPAFNGIMWAFRTLADGFVAIWDVVIWPLISILADGFKWLWEAALRPTIEAIGALFSWLWENVAVPAFEGIGSIVKWVWDNVLVPVFGDLNGTVETVGGWFEWLLGVVDIAFEALGDGIEWVWENIIEPVFSTMGDIITGLVDIFSTAVEGMGNAWQWLKDFLTSPLRAVIRFVNDYLIGGINTVLGWVNIDGIKEITVPEALQPGAVRIPGGGRKTRDHRRVAAASGGILPGYSPGVDDHHFRGKDFDLSLAGGEAIMRPEWTRAVGADFINQMNAEARRGGVGGVRKAMGFSKGGVIPAPKTGGGLGDLIGDLVGHAKNLGGKLMNFLSSPVSFLKDLFLEKLGTLGDNPYVDFVKGAAGKIASGAKDKMLDLIGMGSGGTDAQRGAGGVIPGGMPWQQIWGIIKTLVPAAIMTSNKRAGGSRTASGAISYHGAGRAVDFVSGNMGAAWQLLASLGIPWTELYFTPKGFIRRGRLVPRSIVAGSTKRNHYDHVHVALNKGGIIPSAAEILGLAGAGRGSIPSASDILGGARQDAGFTGDPSVGVYDSGGILNPGDIAVNLGDKPERITTDAQWAAIEAAALRGGDGEQVIWAPQLTTMQGATAPEIADELNWNYKQVARDHKYGRRS